jgi:hypothetical protein
MAALSTKSELIQHGKVPMTASLQRLLGDRGQELTTQGCAMCVRAGVREALSGGTLKVRAIGAGLEPKSWVKLGMRRGCSRPASVSPSLRPAFSEVLLHRETCLRRVSTDSTSQYLFDLHKYDYCSGELFRALTLAQTELSAQGSRARACRLDLSAQGLRALPCRVKGVRSKACALTLAKQR